MSFSPEIRDFRSVPWRFKGPKVKKRTIGGASFLWERCNKPWCSSRVTDGEFDGLRYSSVRYI